MSLHARIHSIPELRIVEPPEILAEVTCQQADKLDLSLENGVVEFRSDLLSPLDALMDRNSPFLKRAYETSQAKKSPRKGQLSREKLDRFKNEKRAGGFFSRQLDDVKLDNEQKEENERNLLDRTNGTTLRTRRAPLCKAYSMDDGRRLHASVSEVDLSTRSSPRLSRMKRSYTCPPSFREGRRALRRSSVATPPPLPSTEEEENEEVDDL